MDYYLRLGGLVAVGFNEACAYLLVITHSGRGVFSTATWERVARDYELAYPVRGLGTGIGPIADEVIAVAELDSDHPVSVVSPDGKYELRCESSGIGVFKRLP